MTPIYRLAAPLALVFLCSGCATEGPATSGAQVRAIMASQIVPPQPRRDVGADGVAAVAAYANYQKEAATPTVHSDSPSFGRK